MARCAHSHFRLWHNRWKRAANQFLAPVETRHLLVTALPGGLQVSTFNNAGQVVGFAFENDGPGYAAITGPNGVGLTRIDLPRGVIGGSSATGINNAGQVIGYLGGDPTRFFVTGPNGIGVTMLPALNNKVGELSDTGQIFGHDLRTAQSFVANLDGSNLRTLPGFGGEYSYITDINSSGQIVGGALTPSSNFHAFVTGPRGEGMTDLGTLGGSDSHAAGLTDDGQVFGHFLTASGPRIFRTDPHGTKLIDLGTFGGVSAYAIDVNEKGQILGYVHYADDSSHVFVTGEHGVGMTDLTETMQVRDGVRGINDAGQILTSAFLLTPVPEPATIVEMLIGLTAVAGIRRRRQRG